jgi:hypothetical protein
MNKEFVPYDIALAMKELGFDEPCIFYYAPDAITISKPTTGVCSSDRYGIIASPLYQQAFRWFREKYNLFILMQVGQHNGEHQTFYFNVFKYGVNLYKSKHRSATGTYTYEEAEHEALRKLIEEVQL